jgi:hypothetical protein
MSDNRYSDDWLKPRSVYLSSWQGWFAAIKITFFPFLVAVLLDVVLAFSSHSVKSIAQLYGLKILSVLIIFYCLLLAFYLVHAYWRGDESRWQQKVGVYSKRFLPALAAFVIILTGTTILLVIGTRMMRLMLPYAHLLGQVAVPILISMIGLLAVIWVVVCFYWPFFIIRDGERFGVAMRKSFAIAGLTKTVMVYMPAISFVLVFLLANPKFPWMHVIDSVWWVLSAGFIVKWLLGAWVVTMTCLMMKQSDIMLVKIEEEMEERKRQRTDKKSKKKDGQ